MTRRIGTVWWLLAFFVCAVTRAQPGDDSLIVPPRIDDDADAGRAGSGGLADNAPATSTRSPAGAGADAPIDAAGKSRNGARLADQPEDREQPLEVVILVGEPEWRLPDLGSDWRRTQEEEERGTDRIELSFVPLYDPENRDPIPDIFERNSELHRLQMIEIIRVRFGGRSRDRSEDQSP